MTTNSVFADRLTKVREERGIKRQQAANVIGITRASLEYYEKGQRKPDTEILMKICDYYKVSADYLLGISNAQITATEDEQLKTVCDYTGLNEKCVKSLIAQRNNGLDHINSIFYTMLENGIFFNVAWKIAEYRKYRALSMAYLRKVVEPFSDLEKAGGNLSKLPNDDKVDIALLDFIQYKDYDSKAAAALYGAQSLIHTKGIIFLPDNDTPQKEYEYTKTNVYMALNSAYQNMIDEELTATENI